MVTKVSRGTPEKTMERISLILAVLKEAKQIHMRGLAKVLDVNPLTVNKIIENYLKPFVDFEYIQQIGGRVKIIRLKPGRENLTIEEVLRYNELKKKIKGA